VYHVLVRCHGRAFLNRTLTAWFDRSNSDLIQKYLPVQPVPVAVIAETLIRLAGAIALDLGSPCFGPFRRKTQQRYQRTLRMGAI
jgi:hypothetical protein